MDDGRPERTGHGGETPVADGLTFSRLVNILARGWRVIVATTAIVVALALAFTLVATHVRVGSRGEVQAGIELRHPAAKLGLSPDGKNLDVSGLKSAGVLKAAVEATGLPVAVPLDTLARAISIQAVAQEELPELANLLLEQTDLMAQVAAAQVDVVPPVRYIVRLNVVDGLGITVEEARVLLDAVVAQYRLYWAERYAGYREVTGAAAAGALAEDFDYIQTAALLDGQLDALREQVQAYLTQEDTAGVQPGRAALLALLDDVEANGTEVLYTHIFAHGLTKDAAGFVALCQKLADERALEAERSRSEVRALEKTLADGGNTAAAGLLRQYVAAGVRAGQAAADATYLQESAQQMRADGATRGPGTGEAEFAGALAREIAAQLDTLTGLVNGAVRDSTLCTMDDHVAQIFPAGSYAGATANRDNLGRNLAIALGCGVVLGLVIVLLRAMITPAPKGRKGVGDA